MLRHLPAVFESPSLYRGDADTPAFEVKFVLTEAQAAEAERLLRPSLAADPHADPTLGGAYRVTSVYFDTAAFDVYRRSENYRRRKYRVRRYGTSPIAFLERKSKSDQEVEKRRTAIPLAELGGLDGAAPDEWSGAWFVKQLRDRGLRPVCRISYSRVALVGSCPEGPIRVTFDRAARGLGARGLDPEPVADGPPLLHDEVVAEFKFLGAMPSVFKCVVERLRLNPRPVSKYRRCVEAAGLVPEGANA
ncbi:MAG TPA: polyphosphate polymerase domain-containing protein [Gemmataceae bacterium]|nr:polyphosphate polymerase domain-containing protein [Gemmataceae bacterium]